MRAARASAMPSPRSRAMSMAVRYESARGVRVARGHRGQGVGEQPLHGLVADGGGAAYGQVVERGIEAHADRAIGAARRRDSSCSAGGDPASAWPSYSPIRGGGDVRLPRNSCAAGVGGRAARARSRRTRAGWRRGREGRGRRLGRSRPRARCRRRRPSGGRARSGATASCSSACAAARACSARARLDRGRARIASPDERVPERQRSVRAARLPAASAAQAASTSVDEARAGRRPGAPPRRRPAPARARARRRA